MSAPLASLNSLLKATARAQVEKCLSLTFAMRNEVSDECTEALCAILLLEDKAEGEALRCALLECIHVSLSSGSVEALAALFGERGGDVDPKLQSLVGKTIDARLAGWKEAAAMSRVSLPRLVDHDWTLHLQQSSSQVAAMNVPTVRIQLKIEEQPSQVGEMPQVNSLDLELSRETLGTMLDGLGKIKEQLAMMGK